MPTSRAARRAEQTAAIDAVLETVRGTYPGTTLTNALGLSDGRLVVYVDAPSTDAGRVALLAVRGGAERAGFEVTSTTTGLRCLAGSK